VADLKRWFKVWSTIVHDPHFQELPLEDVARWVLVGALMVSSGEHGRLRSPGGARALCGLLRVGDASVVKACINRLPHMRIEEGQSDNGEFTVIMDNWFKYQEDSTAYERLKRSRSKRRGEESRGEKKRLPPSMIPPRVGIEFQIPDSIQAALERSPILGHVPRLREAPWWQAQVRANGRRGVDFAAELLKAEAWLTTNPQRAPKKDHARFLHTWLGRAEGSHA